MKAALDGIRVLDFTQHVNGPLGTMLLGDFGADVIKVEPPGGDTMRRNGETQFGDDAVYFLSLNRNKRSIVIDLATETGKETARQLAAHADIVVENFRPGVAEKLGIGYEALSEINPRLIYCTTSAFGRGGEDSGRPGMDPVVQAMSGMMQLTGDDATGPLKTGVAFSDVVTPLLSTIGVMAALQARHATGRGQKVELSMLDASIFCMVPREGFYFATGGTPARIGNAHYEIVPYNTYRTSDDRHVMVIAHSDKYWRLLAEAVGSRALLDDTRLDTKAGRLAHREVVDSGLATAFAGETLAHWNDVLTRADAMFAPVRTFPEVFEDPCIKRDLLLELEHPRHGPFRLVGNPIRLSDTPHQTYRIPPALGEHTDEIRAEFGLKPD